MNARTYRRDCLLGALGALLMLVGDLCLSWIPAFPGDAGLFAREAYLNGSYPAWRLPLLLGAEFPGIALCIFTVRASLAQVRPEHRKLRAVIAVSGGVYVTSAGVIHLFIGSLADWTSTLSPLLGSRETEELIAAKYARLAPTLILPYAGMIVLILASAWGLLGKKTFLPRRMFFFHMLTWQLVFVLIPDIRQALGASVSTWDFVLSQGSGNAALAIWMLANALWARKIPTEEAVSHE